MSVIQPGTSVQDLARTLMQTFEANRDDKQPADDFDAFLSRLLTGVAATSTATNGPSVSASPASPTAVRATDLRFDGVDRR